MYVIMTIRLQILFRQVIISKSCYFYTIKIYACCVPYLQLLFECLVMDKLIIHKQNRHKRLKILRAKKFSRLKKKLMVNCLSLTINTQYHNQLNILLDQNFQLPTHVQQQDHAFNVFHVLVGGHVTVYSTVNVDGELEMALVEPITGLSSCGFPNIVSHTTSTNIPSFPMVNQPNYLVGNVRLLVDNFFSNHQFLYYSQLKTNQNLLNFPFMIPRIKSQIDQEFTTMIQTPIMLIDRLLKV